MLTDHPLFLMLGSPTPPHGAGFLAIDASHLTHVHNYAYGPMIRPGEDLKIGPSRMHSASPM